MNASYPTAEWQGQIEQAATLWEANANLNLALVSDDGEPSGTNGDQQDDPSFGDIRIGAVPLPSGVLAETFLPPPTNGGTIAGDIVFNSNIQWQIGTGYDLATVAAHEFGHALGLGESTDLLRRHVRHLQRHQDGPGQRRHLRHPVALRRAAVRPVQQQRHPQQLGADGHEHHARTSAATARSPSRAWTTPWRRSRSGTS